MTDPDELAREGDIAIRRMRDEPVDYAQLVQWRSEPHVAELWDVDEPPLTYERAIEKYGPRTRGASPTTSCFIQLSDRPVGYIQCYPWSAYRSEADALGVLEDPNAWGIDVFLGEADLLSTGTGSRAISLMMRFLFAERDASLVALVTFVGNHRAIRAYEKCGFRKVRVVKDTETIGGEYPDCWLMVAARPSGIMAPP